MNRIARYLRTATFRQQLSAAVMAGAICIGLIISLLASWQGSRQIRAVLLLQGEHIAENLASQSALALLYDSEANAEGIVSTTLSFPDVLRVEIRQVDGRPLIVRGKAAVTPAAWAAVPLADPKIREPYLETETGDAWHFVAPVRRLGTTTPFEATEAKDELIGFVRVVQSKESLARAQSRIFFSNLALSLIFSIALAVAVGWLTKRLTHPISALSEGMAKAERGEANARAEVGGPPDIAQMALAFNHMIAALQEREQALRESHARYREVVDSVREVIFQSNAAGEWQLLNPAWHDITGHSVDESIGRPMWQTIGGEGGALLRSWQEKLAKGEAAACRFEFPFDRAGGGQGWLEASLRSRYDRSGAFAGVSGTLNDITEQRLASERLAELNAELEQRVVDRTAKLESANKELESFSYSVSHDLRAPLRAIAGFSQILADEYRQRLDEEGKHYLDNVIQSAEHMAALIEHLLQYSRTGRGSVRAIPARLAPLVQRIATTFGERIAAIGARLDVEEPLATPLGDPTLLEQIVANLVDNALTYHCREGRPQITISSVREGNDVIVSVADNGIGIAPEHHERIFQVFQRLHSQDEYPGTGIGLAIVAKAARTMNGEVQVISALGQGSTFKVRLPAAPDPE